MPKSKADRISPQENSEFQKLLSKMEHQLKLGPPRPKTKAPSKLSSGVVQKIDKIEKTIANLQSEGSMIARRPKALPPPRSMPMKAGNLSYSYATKKRNSEKTQQKLAQLISGGWKALNPASLEDFKANAYLKALVDPERCGLGVGVPDSHVDPTYRYQSIIDRNASELTALFSSDGYLPILTTPDSRSHVYIPVNPIQNGTPYLIADYRSMGNYLRDQTFSDPHTGELNSTEGFRALISDHYDNSSMEAIFVTTDSTTWSGFANKYFYNATGPSEFGNTPYTLPPNVALNKFSGMKQKITAGRHMPRIGVENTTMSMWDPGFSGTGESVLFPYSIITSTGQHIVIAGGYNPVAGSNNIYVTAFVSGIADIPSINDPEVPVFFLGLHGFDSAGNRCQAVVMSSYQNMWTMANPSGYMTGGVGFSIGFQNQAVFYGYQSTTPSPAGVIHIEEFSFGITTFTGAGNVYSQSLEYYMTLNTIRVNIGFPSALTIAQTSNSGTPTMFGVGAFMGSYSIPEFNVFNDGLTAGIRMVSCSTWVQYAGSDLDNSGQIYGSFIADRRLPADRDHSYLTPYAINTTGTAYKGRFADGLYQIWKPESDRDLTFRPFNSVFNFNKTYNVALIYQPAVTNSSGQFFSIRVVSNWEIITYSPLYRNNLKESVVNPQQIIHVFQALHGFPMSMENSTHTTTIASFFDDLWGGIKNVGSSIWNSIAPAVGSKLSDWISAL